MHSLKSQARAVLRLSRQMHECAEQADWSGFIEREETRRQRLEELFACPGIEAQLPDLAAILREVMALDAKSMALGEAEKNRLGREMQGRSQQRQAARVYQWVAAHP